MITAFRDCASVRKICFSSLPNSSFAWRAPLKLPAGKTAPPNAVYPYVWAQPERTGRRDTTVTIKLRCPPDDFSVCPALDILLSKNTPSRVQHPLPKTPFICKNIHTPAGDGYSCAGGNSGKSKNSFLRRPPNSALSFRVHFLPSAGSPSSAEPSSAAGKAAA